ncbi:hypothetical protein TNCV_4770411 [Trichonephila clavipes]|nr:hypothetical protein TNCV_4770411 [Trichonephila clavipes]
MRIPFLVAKRQLEEVICTERKKLLSEESFRLVSLSSIGLNLLPIQENESKKEAICAETERKEFRSWTKTKLQHRKANYEPNFRKARATGDSDEVSLSLPKSKNADSQVLFGKFSDKSLIKRRISDLIVSIGESVRSEFEEKRKRRSDRVIRCDKKKEACDPPLAAIHEGAKGQPGRSPLCYTWRRTTRTVGVESMNYPPFLNVSVVREVSRSVTVKRMPLPVEIESSIDADSSDENEMNNAALVPMSSKIRNIMHSRRSYLDPHSKDEMNLNNGRHRAI